MNKVLVFGASGATGKLLTQQLLDNNISVIAIVRNKSSLPDSLKNNKHLHIIEAGAWEMSETELKPIISECDAIFSCLGHNITFKGIFGHPRKLVTDVIQKTVSVINQLNPAKKIKIILMNTTGNTNRDTAEKPELSQRIILSIIRMLVPPHADNEQAAEVLRVEVGQNHPLIEWVAVRPDGLKDQQTVSDYDILESPTRNVITNPGSTSRINVANFMMRLVLEQNLWQSWQGKMPVLYNKNE